MKLKQMISCGIAAALFLVIGNQVIAGDHGGDIHYTEPVMGVLFSHDVHVDDLGFDCDSCHDGLFEYEALAAQGYEDFNMEALYDGQYCGACHDGSTAFASDTRCASCHEGVKGYQRAHGGEVAAEKHH